MADRSGKRRAGMTDSELTDTYHASFTSPNPTTRHYCLQLLLREAKQGSELATEFLKRRDSSRKAFARQRRFQNTKREPDEQAT